MSEHPLDIAALAHADARVEVGISLVEDAGSILNWEGAKQESEGNLSVVLVPANTEPIVLMLIFQNSDLVAANLQRHLTDGFPVCHVPPGNPSAARTIYVGWNAVRAHVENHGDTVGPCDGDAVGVQYANLLTGVVGHGTLGPGSEVEVTASGHWQGTATLDELFTPVEPRFPEPILPVLPALPTIPEPPEIPIIPSLEAVLGDSQNSLADDRWRIVPTSIIVCPADPDPDDPACVEPEPESCDHEVLDQLKAERDGAEGVRRAFEVNDGKLEGQEREVTYQLSNIRADIAEHQRSVTTNSVVYVGAIVAEVGSGIVGFVTCAPTIGLGCAGAALGVVASGVAATAASLEVNHSRNELASLRQEEMWYMEAQVVLAEARPGFNAGYASAEEGYKTARDAYDSYLHDCLTSTGLSSHPGTNLRLPVGA